MDIVRIHSLFMNCKSVSIDTRKIELNSFFVVLKAIALMPILCSRSFRKGASYVIMMRIIILTEEQS
jgi:UDP-N-acetylmuramoyl-tripeptide--D-alanyl-D-alanine ligase